MMTIFLLCMLEVQEGLVFQGLETLSRKQYKQSCTLHDTAKAAAIANYETASGKYLDITKLYRVDLKTKTMAEIEIPKVKLMVEEDK